MSKYIYILIGVIVTIFLLLSAVFFSVKNHLWREIPSAISYNGIARPDAKCFISIDGDYLIVIRDTGSSSAHYFIESGLGVRRIGTEPGGQYYDLPGYVYTRDYPVRIVLSGTDKFEKYAEANSTNEGIKIYFDSQRYLEVVFKNSD